MIRSSPSLEIPSVERFAEFSFHVGLQVLVSMTEAGSMQMFVCGSLFWFYISSTVIEITGVSFFETLDYKARRPISTSLPWPGTSLPATGGRLAVATGAAKEDGKTWFAATTEIGLWSCMVLSFTATLDVLGKRCDIWWDLSQWAQLLARTLWPTVWILQSAAEVFGHLESRVFKLIGGKWSLVSSDLRCAMRPHLQPHITYCWAA